MTPENQETYMQFQQTINTLRQKRAQLENDIKTVSEQLTNMKQEMVNLDATITTHTGGMSTIEVLTTNGYAIVKWDNPEVPLTLSPHQAPQQQVQQQAQQPAQPIPQPTQPAITQQAQQAFAPRQVPDFTPTIQGPQMGQGSLPTE